MSNTDKRIFTIRSTDGELVLNARFADAVEGWKTAIQCSWDLVRKETELEEGPETNTPEVVISRLVDLTLAKRFEFCHSVSQVIQSLNSPCAPLLSLIEKESEASLNYCVCSAVFL